MLNSVPTRMVNFRTYRLYHHVSGVQRIGFGFPINRLFVALEEKRSDK